MRFEKSGRHPIWCGPAGGRPKGLGRPHDHARTDLPEILAEHDNPEPPTSLAGAVGVADRRHRPIRPRTGATAAPPPPPGAAVRSNNSPRAPRPNAPDLAPASS